MNRRYRKTIIAGNWKMNKNPAETKEFMTALKPYSSAAKWCDVVLCVPSIDLLTAVRSSRNSKIDVAAQNMHYEENGAYTGEISPQMLSDVGVKYVVIGHSERRQYFGETDEMVSLKVNTALKHAIRPIVCVGESLNQREKNLTLDYIRIQVKSIFNDISPMDVKKVIIAYEPIWAIGTGKTATAKQANEVCAAIRECIRELYDARHARTVTILYGGSMNPKNAAELMAMPDIDGGLVGGASLDPKDFAEIIEAANQ